VRTINDGWLSTGPGALIATYPMHDAGMNRLFTAGRDPFLFSVPMLWDKEQKFRTLTRTPPSNATDLHTNLTHFRDRYSAALARGPLREKDRDADHADTDEEFDIFPNRFREKLAEELQRTKTLISEYRLLAGVADG